MNTKNTPSRERNPFLEAVGRVTIAGTQLDASLHALLGSIAFEPTLLMHVNGGSTDQLIQMCRLALTVGTTPPADAAEATVCLDRAHAIRVKRNQVVHSIYTAAETGDGLEAMRPIRKSMGHRVMPITVEEMEALADSVEVLRSDLFRAGWNIRVEQMGGGMERMPPRAPGQRVNGVLPAE